MRETEQNPNIETGEKSNIQQFLASAHEYAPNEQGSRFSAMCTEFNIERLLQEISEENSTDAAQAKDALDKAAKGFLDIMTTRTIKDDKLQGNSPMAAGAFRESFTTAKKILGATGSIGEYSEKITTVETALTNAGA